MAGNLEEYILLENESHKTFQCKLNQWRNDYLFTVVWMDVKSVLTGVGHVTETRYFALIRRKKR